MGYIGKLSYRVLSKELLDRMPFFINLVKLVADRSTCRPDRKGGAILINSSYRVISQGYNGTPPKVPHCNERKDGCLKYNNSCIGTLHAEINCLANSSIVIPDDALMLCTLKPCLSCLKTLMSFRVNKILYLEDYPDPARDVFIGDIQANMNEVEELYTGDGKMSIKHLTWLLDNKHFIAQITMNGLFR